MHDLLKIEELKNWKRVGCLILVIGALQFIILTFTAMIFYPGGYSFVNNYFSHLGYKEVAGEPNTISHALFLIATVVAGFGLIPFWIIIQTLFTKTRTMNITSVIGTLLGVISAPFLIGLGIFSADTHPNEHGFTTMVFFLLFAAAIAVYSIAMFFNDDYPSIYGSVGVAFSIVIVLFVFGVFTLINVLMQKIIVYGFILWTVFQVTNVWKAVGPKKPNE